MLLGNPKLHSNQQNLWNWGYYVIHHKMTHKWQMKGSVKVPNISIYFFFSAHHLMVFYFRCSVYWWKGSVRF